jgi:hypothetical protein
VADPRKIRELLGLGGMDAALEEERRKLAEMDLRSAAYSTGDMRSHDPSFRESMISGAGRIGDYIGAPHMRSDTANIVNEFAPGISTAASFDDAKQAAQGGRYGAAAGNAALGLLDVIPGAGALAGAGIGLASKAGRDIMGKGAEKAVKKVTEAAGDVLPVVEEFSDSAKKEMKAKIRKILGGQTDAPTSPRLGEPKTQQSFSKVTARRPIKEMTASYRPSDTLLPERFIKPEDFKVGDYVYPLPGDRTIAGRSLYEVNEMPFRNAIDMLGGGGYMRGKFQQGPDRSGWANALGNAREHANDIRDLSQKGGTVHGGFVTMGADASDFSRESGDAVRQALLARRPFISPNDAELFNKLMREGGTASDPRFPDFPGIFNMSDEYLNSSGDMRKKLIKRMDSTDVMDRGFPDIGAIRKALTEEDLYNANTLDMGWAFSKMDPEGRLITDPAIKHPSYPAQIGGTYEGRFKHLAPMEVHSPDWWRERERIKPNENPSQRGYTYKLELPGQPVTDEWIDLNMGYQEAVENGNPEEYLQRIRRGAGF